MKRNIFGIAAAAVIAAASLVGPAATAAGCAGASGGGEWRSYGRNLSNARNQPLETQISPANVADLQPAWSFSVVASGGKGGIDSTPVIADGCMFVVSNQGSGGTTGSAFAVDADNGNVVWRTDLAIGPGYIAGAFAPAVANGAVYILAGQPEPYVVALDEATGAILWKTSLPDPLNNFGINASAVVFDGMVFVATFGGDLILPFSRPPFYILDADDGSVLKKTYVIPFEDQVDGFQAGPGIWGTAVVDSVTKNLFVGTGNPYNKVKEHERTNAIIKVDVDRSSPTFGEVVDSYKGDYDYDENLYATPQCQLLGEAQLVGYSVLCGQQDVDFGASPNLFTTSTGRVLVGNFQKSGTYHAVDPETMEVVWKAEDLAPPAQGGNAAGTAFDDTAIYVATDGGTVHALNKDTGASLWTAGTSATGSHYQPVSVANGVVYGQGSTGSLYALDAAGGATLFDAQMGDGNGTCSSAQVGGVAIARNTVYATCGTGADGGGVIYAYR